jgi:OmpA-OmpF porin, OOP family
VSFYSLFYGKKEESMRSTKFGVFVGLIILALGIVGNVMAENRPCAFTVSPLIGGYVFEGDQDLENSASYGIGIGYNFDQHWGLEGVFNFVDTESEISDKNVNAFLYRLDALYHFNPDHRLVPYLAAGIGGITLDPDVEKNDTDFLMNYGGGLKYFITDSTILRGDVRHIMTLDETHHNLAYSAGLTFLFGGGEEPVVEQKIESENIDTDGDGVYDHLDKCPGTPQGVRVDSNGCPLDTDGDGVYDYLDKCPGTPQGVQVDSNGCPLDTDGDGVYDYLDKCPGTPEGATVDTRGCWVIKDVLFDFAKWDIKPVAYRDLDNIVTILKENPLLKVEIQGHTDIIGSKSYNVRLSENRAKAVMEYLIDKGVERDRLSAKGFWFSMPAASNDTTEGRALNRRVELVLIR